MTTQAGALAKLSVACREQLREKLALRFDPVSEVRRIDAFLDAERIDVYAIRAVINAERTRSTLGTLAPLAFGRVCGLVAEVADAIPDQRAVSAAAQAALAEAVTVADAEIATAARNITAQAIEQVAVELDYAVGVRQWPSATEMELRRGNQIIRLRIHHGADAASEYAEPSHVLCCPWQPDLERGLERQGFILTKCHQCYYAGGRAATGVCSDSSMVCITVLSTDQDAASASARRVATGAYAVSSHLDLAANPRKERF